jgi:hypothetical protein
VFLFMCVRVRLVVHAPVVYDFLELGPLLGGSMFGTPNDHDALPCLRVDILSSPRVEVSLASLGVGLGATSRLVHSVSCAMSQIYKKVHKNTQKGDEK